MQHQIQVDRTFELSLTYALMFVLYEEYVFVLTISSFSEILDKAVAKFPSIVTGSREYQTTRESRPAPHLLGIFDLLGNK